MLTEYEPFITIPSLPCQVLPLAILTEESNVSQLELLNQHGPKTVMHPED